MAGITLAGSNQALANSLPTIYREFRLLRDDSGVCRSCATNLTLGAHEGNSKYINNYGRLQGFAVTDGQDIMQMQQLSDAVTSYTPSEVAVQVVLGGRTMRRVADPGLQERTARILNNAYDLKEDGDGCTNLANFTATTLGAAGTVISPGHVAGSGARVMIGNNRVNPEPPASDIYSIMHPLTAHALAGRLIPYATTPAGGTAYGAAGGAHVGVSMTIGSDPGGLSSDLIRQGYKAIGTIGNVIVKTDANVPITGADATGATFAKEAYIYVSEEEPRIDWDTSDKSMRGAAEGNCWGSYVWGTYRAGVYGNPMTFDASFPTS